MSNLFQDLKGFNIPNLAASSYFLACGEYLRLFEQLVYLITQRQPHPGVPVRFARQLDREALGALQGAILQLQLRQPASAGGDVTSGRLKSKG